MMMNSTKGHVIHELILACNVKLIDSKIENLLRILFCRPFRHVAYHKAMKEMNESETRRQSETAYLRQPIKLCMYLPIYVSSQLNYVSIYLSIRIETSWFFL